MSSTIIYQEKKFDYGITSYVWLIDSQQIGSK